MWDYLNVRRDEIAFASYQHLLLVVECVLVATLVAVAIAVLVTRVKALEPVANAVSAIGLTLPSFALLGLLVPVAGLGVPTAFAVITFYAVLPILRNAVVGLQGVDAVLLESARGMGLSPVRTLMRVELPLAWPVVLAGVRTSAQMSMGIAAVASYVLGPGLGYLIFSGLASIGSANALYAALSGTVLIVVLAFVLDGALILLGRTTTSKGIRV